MKKRDGFSLRNVANGGEMIHMCFVAMAFGECNRNKFIELGYIFTSVLRMQNVMHTVQSIESVHIASPTEAADQ